MKPHLSNNSCFYNHLVKPEVYLPYKIVGTVNKGIELRCRIEASPKPTTVWTRKKGLIYCCIMFLTRYIQILDILLVSINDHANIYFSWNASPKSEVRGRRN